ncbi:MAG TPA: OsmC family protein [Thermoanaerobaculia bacterium]|nr:OsmC family protein [Thermoanaerobaculia bacterium]
MAVRHANAVWEGSLKEGKGSMRLESGAFEGAYSFSTRFEEAPGTNPEELIGAAHAGCFSMALSGALGKAGFTPTRIQTRADVHLEKVGEGFSITRIHLTTEAEIPGMDQEKFREQAEGAKANCPVSRALKGVEISLDAKLVG